MKQRHTSIAFASSVLRSGAVTVMLLLVMALFVMPRLALADSSDIQFDATANVYSATAVHSLSVSFTVGNNSNRYLAFGVSLSADTTSDTIPAVSGISWTVGSTTQTFTFKQGQNSTTGSDDTARAEIHQLVAPTVGSGTLTVTLDTKAITGETADSSPTGSTTVNNESLGTGDGSATTFSGTLANTPVVRQTLTITAGSVTATDDGTGILSGTGVTSGSINYDAGAWSITYGTAPSSGTAITADYQYGEWKFSGTLANTPVDPSSVTFSATVGGSTKTASDNGSGSVTGDGGNISGTINYTTGAWTLEYQTPPDSGTSITADYDRQNQAQIVAGAVSLYNVNQSTPSPTGTASGGDSTVPFVNISSDTRHAVFAVISTTGPAGTATARSNITERWNHKNGTGNTDTIGAGGTAPGVAAPSATLMAWDLTNSRKWAAAGIDIQPPNPPTLARFARVKAISTDHGTLVRWRTGYEVDNLGFRIWREVNGRKTRVNRGLVAGSALFAGPSAELRSGRSYTIWDKKSRGETPAVYWIEDLSIDGSSTWHGPYLSVPATTKEQERLSEQLGIELHGSPVLSALNAGLRVPASPTVRLNPVSMGHGSLEEQWALASQPGAKISVSHEGWYRVTRAQLAAAGFDPGPDPTNLQLWTGARQVATRISGMEDGFFDQSDAVEFYGRGMDTPSTGTRVYWLVVGDSPGLRIQRMGYQRPLPIVREQKTYTCTIERQDKNIYVAGLTENGNRDNFYGGVVSSTPADVTLTLDHVKVEGAGETTPVLQVSLQGFTAGEHVVELSFNGHDLGAVSFQGQDLSKTKYELQREWLVEGNNTLSLTAQGGESDVSLLDYVKVSYSRPYVAIGDQLEAAAYRGAFVEINGFNGDDVHVFDVTDPTRPLELSGTVLHGDAGRGVAITVPGYWSDNPQKAQLYAFADDRMMVPDRVVANVPSDWHAAGNGADLLIISHPDFMQAAAELAAHRRQQSLNARVVNLDDVYDEFSFGEKDPAAIRSFLKNAVDTWKTVPKYVALLGDASFDPRNYLGKGDFDFVPTHIAANISLKTADEDWFVDLSGDGRPDLALGRLPVRTPEAAESVVQKIIGYDSAPQGGWADKVELVADQGEDGAFSFEKATKELDALVPADLSSQEILIGQVGEDAARQQILDAFNEGRLLINYNGHGSEAVWTTHGVLTAEDANGMTNGEKLPLVIAMNCLNGLFQDIYQQSMAESLLLAPDGGAVAVWASSALTDPSGQTALNMALFNALFGSGGERLGDAILKAKAKITDPYVRSSWIFFGDPSMKLKH